MLFPHIIGLAWCLCCYNCQSSIRMSEYRTDIRFCDRNLGNSVGPDQTAPEGAV